MLLLNDLSKAKILVIGDVMLDRYWWGDVARISPEAPVPVVRLTRTTIAAGGAANVAINVAGLGAKVMLVGVVGRDAESGLLRGELDKAEVSGQHLLDAGHRPTTVKTRIVAHGQQVARVDQETEASLDKATAEKLGETLSELIPTCDALIVSDYAKGLLTDDVLAGLFSTARHAQKPVFVDPKGKEYQKYRGAAVITPNRREAAEACHLTESSDGMVERAGARLIADLGVESVLITQGEEGMTLFRRDRPSKHFPTTARQVYDVTGAGDTVIATLATALGAGADIETAANLANVAAGLVVGTIGTTHITATMLREGLDKEKTDHLFESRRA